MLTLKNIDKCYEECDEIQTYMRAQAYMQTQAIRFTKMYDVSTLATVVLVRRLTQRRV